MRQGEVCEGEGAHPVEGQATAGDGALWLKL